MCVIDFERNVLSDYFVSGQSSTHFKLLNFSILITPYSFH